ncbi:MAG: FmdB family zinc ribbon protein [Burkholderiales bacterium]
MPIYEYRCSSCGFQKEYLRKISDPLMTDCPECGKRTFSKMLTAAGFHLKGSGWYATDFRNSGAKPAAKADSAGAGKTEGKAEAGSDGKSEAKPEGKTEAKPEGKTETKSESTRRGTGPSPACS